MYHVLLVKAENREAAIAAVLNDSKRVTAYNEILGGDCPVDEWLVCEWLEEDHFDENKQLIERRPRLFMPMEEDEEIPF
jgi:hypothetical protein